MIGYHAASLIADSYAKGYRNFDVKEAYRACLRTAEYDTTGIITHPRVLPHLMPQAKYWKNKIGYVPCDKDNESVAKALEYAYDDWCIAQVAKKLGKTNDAAMLEKASQNYKNLFDPETRLMRGRKAVAPHAALRCHRSPGAQGPGTHAIAINTIATQAYCTSACAEKPSKPA